MRVTDPGGVVEELRLKVFDTFQRIKPRAYQDVGIRIVDIDDSSLERIGQWPWPRTVVARLVTRLTELGAAVIVFDIVFAELGRDRPVPVRIDRTPHGKRRTSLPSALRPRALGTLRDSR